MPRIQIQKKVVTAILCFLCMAFNVKAQKFKVIAYNIEFAKNTTPEEMAKELLPEKAAIICFNEVPGQGWTKRVGELLNLHYSYEGKIASANHEKGFNDKTGKYYGKYKSILSKYPLKNLEEIALKGAGWSPSTAVVADVRISKNNYVKVFSIHVPSGEGNPNNSKANDLAKIISEKFPTEKRMIIAGDFNDIHMTAPMKDLYSIGFKDAWSVSQKDLSKKTSYPSYQRPGYIIDHLLFKGLKAKEAEIIEKEGKPLSDHKAVWAIFKL